MDLSGKSSEDLAVIEHLLALPLGKFSELRTDQRLTGYFRGGVGVPHQVTQWRNGSVKDKGVIVNYPCILNSYERSRTQRGLGTPWTTWMKHQKKNRD